MNHQKRKPLMRRITLRKVLRVVLPIVAIILTVKFVLLPVGWWAYGGWALHAFEANPSQEGADRLGWLLLNEKLTLTQGNRAVELILTPEVLARDAYEVGGDLPVYLHWPYLLRARPGIAIQVLDATGAEVVPRVATNSGLVMVDDIWKVRWGDIPIWLTPAPEEPGDYQMTAIARLSFRIIVLNASQNLADRFPGTPIPYSATVTIPLDYKVVPPGQGQNAKFVSSPVLDASMSQAVKVHVHRELSARYRPPDDGMELGLQIYYRDLPENVCFKVSFQHPDGREVPIATDREKSCRFRDGIQLIDDKPVVAALGPGTHTGTLILRTDRAAANADPRMDTVWDGELEFPVEIVVEEQGRQY